METGSFYNPLYVKRWYDRQEEGRKRKENHCGFTENTLSKGRFYGKITLFCRVQKPGNAFMNSRNLDTTDHGCPVLRAGGPTG